MNVSSELAISGARNFEVSRSSSTPATQFRHLLMLLAMASPFAKGIDWEIRKYRVKNAHNVFRGAWRILMAIALGVPTYYGAAFATIIRGDGTIEEYGCVSTRVVTTAGVNFLVDSFQNTTEPENFKYHGFGTGTTAEASGQTALVTEETTQYNPDSTRPTGSQTEGASANIYRTVATYTPDSGSNRAITEHGVFSQAATGGGTMLDRSVFSALNLDSANGDSLQITYELTLPAGS